jgi:hypothetical protein
MEHTKMITKTLETEAGNLHLTYRLLASGQEEGVTQYGVSVSNDTTGETAQVSDLTTDPSQAAAFLEMVSSGLVTPVTFWEIAQDFVAGI